MIATLIAAAPYIAAWFAASLLAGLAFAQVFKVRDAV